MWVELSDEEAFLAAVTTRLCAEKLGHALATGIDLGGFSGQTAAADCASLHALSERLHAALDDRAN